MMVSHRLWMTGQLCAIIESSVSDPSPPMVTACFAAPHFPHRSVPATTKISACSQLPVARSEYGLSREFILPTRPLSGGSKPDGCPSVVQSRHARHPSGVFSRTGKICTPAALDARPLRRRNSGQLFARMRAARTLVTFLADSVSIVISRVTVGG